MIFMISMTEDELQALVVQWLEAALPVGSVVHHSPNEGKRHVAYKMRLKRLGMVSGWPDLQINVPEHGWLDPVNCGHTIMIELKRPGGGKLSANQKDIQERLQCCGVHTVTAKRLAHVEAYLKPLLALRTGGRASLLKQLCQVQGG